MRQHHGVEISCERLLAAQFVAPIAVPDLWVMGERLKLLQRWLIEGGEEEDNDAPPV
jgi:hypothetical protein